MSNVHNNPVVNDLWDNIRKEIVYRNFTKARYVPYPALKALMCKHVTGVLRDSCSHGGLLVCPNSKTPDESYVQKLVSFVMESEGADKIFATLAMIKMPWLISRFYAAGVRRDVLPVQVRQDCAWQIESMKKSLSTHEQDDIFKDFHSPPGSKEASEDEHWMEQFCTYQWMFMSPIFDSKIFKYSLESDVRMPYVDYAPVDELMSNPERPDETSKGQSGGFGDVDHRVIHEGHLVLLEDQVSTSPHLPTIPTLCVSVTGEPLSQSV
jgi:hypothetical protein